MVKLVKRFDDQKNSDTDEHGSVEECGEYLRPTVAECPGRSVRTLRQPVRHIGDDQRQHVAEVVHGIAQQRQRTGENPSHNL